MLTVRNAGIGAIVFITACATTSARTTPVTTAPSPSTPDMTTLCLGVIDGDQGVVSRLAANPLVRKMADGMREQVAYTPDEFANAALAQADDPRFSWRRLHDNARFVRPFLQTAPERLPSLLVRDAVIAGEFVGVHLRPDEIPVHLVCGGPWDAYVLIFDDGSELYFDVGWLADTEVETAMIDFEALLTHELWHFAFLDHQKARWSSDYKHCEDAACLFIYEMVNEGIGHYYSMRPRLYPSNTIENFADKAAGAFALLGTKYPQLVGERDAQKRSDMLWHSHAGVPFWEKWGAVPGALVAYRLAEALGRDGVRALLADEPFSILVAYDGQCSTHAEWPRLPPPLVQDARALASRHLAKATPPVTP